MNTLLFQRIKRTGIVGFLLLGVVWALFPIVWIVLTSFKAGRDILTIPPVWIPFPPSFENYVALFPSLDHPFVTSIAPFFLNTLTVGLGATALAMIVGCPAAYIFARRRLGVMRLIFFVILVTRMFPVISLAVPLYLVLTGLGLRDTRTGLILAYTSLSLPFVIWMMQAFFQDFPWELEEAAMVDGSSRFGAFIRVALPLSAPAWWLLGYSPSSIRGTNCSWLPCSPRPPPLKPYR